MLRGLPPLSNPNLSKILILGSMPSSISLEQKSYYANLRNQFWPMMEYLFSISRLSSYELRCQQLINKHIAVWDVLAQCTRQGSLDSAIIPSSIVVNDIGQFVTEHRKIKHIFFNGRKAEQIFNRYIFKEIVSLKPDIQYHSLPSTSPANAGISMESKQFMWKQITQYL